MTNVFYMKYIPHGRKEPQCCGCHGRISSSVLVLNANHTLTTPKVTPSGPISPLTQVQVTPVPILIDT